MASYTGHRELVTLLFNTIVNSPDIQQQFNGQQVLLYDTVAPPEPELPYLVHRVTLGPASLEDTITVGDYDLSVYTYEQGNQQVNQFVDILINLLNNEILKDGNVNFAYLSLMRGGSQVDTENSNVNRYDLPFELRYTI